MQPLDQDSLYLPPGSFVYLEITFSNTPLFGPTKSDFMAVFNNGAMPGAKLIDTKQALLGIADALPGQNDDYFLFQIGDVGTTGSTFIQLLQTIWTQGLGQLFRIDNYTVTDSALLEPGDTNPLNSSQVVGADGKSWTNPANNPNNPSFLCKELGIGCTGGFNVSTVLIFLAVAIALVAVAYTTKTIRTVI